MHKRLFASALAAAATVVMAGSLSALPAMASDGGGGGGGGRPCGNPVMTSGAGTLGSPFTLKSMYDDDGAVPGVVVGEEFQINNQPAGTVWAVTLSDNGKAFFTGNVTAVGEGINATKMTPYDGSGTSHMTAHAVDPQTGEVVNGSVSLLAPPPRCGH